MIHVQVELKIAGKNSRWFLHLLVGTLMCLTQLFIIVAILFDAYGFVSIGHILEKFDVQNMIHYLNLHNGQLFYVLLHYLIFIFVSVFILLPLVFMIVNIQLLLFYSSKSVLTTCWFHQIMWFFLFTLSFRWSNFILFFFWHFIFCEISLTLLEFF